MALYCLTVLALATSTGCRDRAPVVATQVESFHHGLGDMKPVDLGKAGSFLLGSVSEDLRIKRADAPWSAFAPVGVSTSWLGVEREDDDHVVLITASMSDPRVRIYRVAAASAHAELLSIVDAPSLSHSPVRIDPAIVRDLKLPTHTDMVPFEAVGRYIA